MSPSRALYLLVTTEDNVIVGTTPPIPLATPSRGGGLVLAGLGVVAFSLSLPMTKIAVRGLDPTVAALGRAAVAAAFAAMVVALVRPARPNRHQIISLLVVVAGVVIGFPLLTAYALRHTESLHGSVVNGILPLATAGLAVVRAGERPSGRYWACSCLGFAAVVGFVISEGGGQLHLADVLLVLAVAAAAAGYAEGALLARDLGGWQVICWALLIGAPLTFGITAAAAFRTGLSASPGEWVAFGYTALSRCSSVSSPGTPASFVQASPAAGSSNWRNPRSHCCGVGLCSVNSSASPPPSPSPSCSSPSRSAAEPP